jgi:hypothetical protein
LGESGCPARRSLDGFPEGWSYLIGHETPLEKANVTVEIDGRPRRMLDLERLAWRHDVTLCPEHTKMLVDLLWTDPGADPLLSKTGGHA